MPNSWRIIRLKDIIRSFLAVWRHGTGCSPHKNRHRLHYSKFNGSCLVLVDLLVSEWHHYTLTNPHEGYWNDRTVYNPDTFEIPEWSPHQQWRTRRLHTGSLTYAAMWPPIRHVGAYSSVSQSPRKTETSSTEITAVSLFQLIYRLTRDKHVCLRRCQIWSIISDLARWLFDIYVCIFTADMICYYCIWSQRF